MSFDITATLNETSADELSLSTNDSNHVHHITEVDTSEFKDGLRAPTSGNADISWYYGAYVFEPEAGVHHNVVYPDYSSLYPNMMKTLNLGFTTLVGEQHELDASKWTEDDCVWGYIDPRPVKHCGPNDQWGMYSDGEYKCIRQWKYKDGRKKWKTRWVDDPQYERLYFLKRDIVEGEIARVVDDALEYKEQYRGTEKYESSKRVVNSIYGYMGYSTEYNEARLFDTRIAEAVTLTSRRVIQHAGDVFPEYINRNTDLNAKLIYGDTDSIVSSMENASTRHEVLKVSFEAAKWMNEVEHNRFMKELCNADPDEHFMEIEIESYAPKMYLHNRKKKYFQRITWED